MPEKSRVFSTVSKYITRLVRVNTTFFWIIRIFDISPWTPRGVRVSRKECSLTIKVNDSRDKTNEVFVFVRTRSQKDWYFKYLTLGFQNNWWTLERSSWKSWSPAFFTTGLIDSDEKQSISEQSVAFVSSSEQHEVCYRLLMTRSNYRSTQT